MAQGLIGGGTSYEEQSIQDILSDINNWVEYTKETIILIQEGIDYLKKCRFWDEIPFNFQMTLFSTITCQNTYLHDFGIIVKSINEDKVTKREVELLKKIGSKAWEFNNEYGKTYKEEYRWKKYGDPDFKVAENLYAKGRDFFVTLQDASNASSRLADYISEVPATTNTNITQHISGSMNMVTGINNGVINQSMHDLSSFRNESEVAIKRIGELTNIEQEIKEYIKDILLNSAEAIENNDRDKKEQCKSDYKGFLIGAGAKAFKIIGVLSSFASIASFFGISL